MPTIMASERSSLQSPWIIRATDEVIQADVKVVSEGDETVIIGLGFARSIAFNSTRFKP